MPAPVHMIPFTKTRFVLRFLSPMLPSAYSLPIAIAASGNVTSCEVSPPCSDCRQVETFTPHVGSGIHCVRPIYLQGAK